MDNGKKIPYVTKCLHLGNSISTTEFRDGSESESGFGFGGFESDLVRIRIRIRILC